jgi:hypothetical protein
MRIWSADLANCINHAVITKWGAMVQPKFFSIQRDGYRATE